MPRKKLVRVEKTTMSREMSKLLAATTAGLAYGKIEPAFALALVKACEVNFKTAMQEAMVQKLKKQAVSVAFFDEEFEIETDSLPLSNLAPILALDKPTETQEK